MSVLDSFPLKIQLSPVDKIGGLRADLYLSEEFPDLSRSRWAKALQKGFFSIEGRKLKASSVVEEGQLLELLDSEGLQSFLQNDAQRPSVLASQKERVFLRADTIRFRSDTEPKILFEDEHLLVLDKPCGLTVHPGAGVDVEETLVAWLIEKKKVFVEQEWAEEVQREGRPGIVHRLDKGTSGCLLVAKNPEAFRALAAQFKNKSARRSYWAVVDGNATSLQSKLHRKARAALEDYPQKLAFRVLKDGKHSLAAPLGRDEKNRLRYAVSPVRGKAAITHFKILSYDKVEELFEQHADAMRSFGVDLECFPQEVSYSLLDLDLETGRTHQIRVHCSFLGLPILGDNLYGGQAFERTMLHAYKLSFTHPKSNEEMTFYTKRSQV